MSVSGTVLLLEDDQGIVRLEQKRLERAGFSVIPSSTPAEALRHIEAGGVDLLVLDYQLEARVTGVDFYRELQAAGRHIPSILVTGLGNEDRLLEALRAGMRDFIPKTPDYLDYLAPTVERVMRQVRAEQALALAEVHRQSEERVRVAVDSMLECFALHTAVRNEAGQITDFKIDYLNTASAVFRRARKEDLIGQRIIADLGSAFDRSLFDQLCAVVDTGLPFKRDDWEVMPPAPGRAARRRWFDISAAKVGNGFAASWREVTDKKEADLDLHRAKQAAEEANAAKDRFLATLSHELRTPLTPILAVVSTLQDDLSLPETVRGDMNLILRNVELEGRLIDDLLDLTRIVQGKVQLNRESTSLDQQILHSIEICKGGEYADKKHPITSDLQASSHHLQADAARITQVVCNLIRNAQKFTPPGGKIFIRTRDGHLHGRRSVFLEVEDTGIGIAPDVLPHIFEAFSQGSQQITRQFGGLGLGLTISRAIVEMHEGEILAESDGRSGSIFRVALPVTPRSSESRISPQDARHQASPAREPSLHILLLEDHGDTAYVMMRLLKRQGHQVRWCASIRQAVESVEEAEVPFDLVISDLGLPDGSGLELLHRLRQNPPPKGISLSGYGMEEDIRKSRDAGFERHLTKPVNFQNLKSVIAELTRKAD